VSGRGIAAGTFETAKFEALATLIQERDVFWDVGAHYGYATLVGVRATGEGGEVLAFEPSEQNRWFLHRHLRWNGGTNVRVLPVAVADQDGTESFGGASSSSIAQSLGAGEDSVTVRSVASLLDDGHPSPDVIKIDVEGAESRVLAGASEALSAMAVEERPSVLCAVHDPEQFEECTRVLRSLDYAVTGAGWFSAYLDGGQVWSGDPDILAIAPPRSALLDRMRSTDLFRHGPEL